MDIFRGTIIHLTTEITDNFDKYNNDIIIMLFICPHLLQVLTKILMGKTAWCLIYIFFFNSRKICGCIWRENE